MSPGQVTDLGSVLGAIDDAGDALCERLRGRRWADAAAAILSNLSDYGFVWVLAAAVKARRPGKRRRRAVAALAIAGCASYGVNRLVKGAVRRDRPPCGAPGSWRDVPPVRRPASSSFPSGHTLAAFCTAAVLSENAAQAAVALGFASAVAASRVHLRAHHTSDVLGGALIGATLGAVLRPVVDVLLRGE